MSTLSLSSQLLLKHIDEILDQNTLVVDPLESEDFNHADFKPCHIWAFKDLDSKHPNITTWPMQPEGQFNQAIVFFPKSKEKAAWLISLLQNILAEGCIIYLVGDNRSGIKTCAKRLLKQLNNIHKIASGKHCLLYSGDIIKPQQAIQHFRHDEYLVDDKTLSVASLPGVFSHGELDAGTELLLKNLPKNISGNVLDFACGCGVIGGFIGKYNPKAQLTLCDIDSVALTSAQQTIKMNKLSANFVLSDGLKKVSSKFQWIFSNPPFHTGMKIDYYISEAFIKSCSDHLEPSGKLYLVANRFLKYPQVLQNNFDLLEVIAEDNKFKLYCAYNR